MGGCVPRRRASRGPAGQLVALRRVRGASGRPLGCFSGAQRNPACGCGCRAFRAGAVAPELQPRSWGAPDACPDATQVRTSEELARNISRRTSIDPATLYPSRPVLSADELTGACPPARLGAPLPLRERREAARV